MEIIKLIRVHQWIKNGLLFLPIFFGGMLFEAHLFLEVGLGFLSFSFIASSIYIINDYNDIEKDKLHPTKKFRPLAAETISKKQAKMIFMVVFFIGFTIAFFLKNIFLYIIGFYFLMNLAYSFKLKRIALVDICIIALGFVLRIYAGGFLANIEVSRWLILIAFLAAMLIALSKRRAEYLIYEQGSEIRKSMYGYNLEFINTAMVLMAAITVVSYIMYTVSDEVVERIGSDNLYLSSFFVILGILRLLQITIVYQKSGSPTKMVFNDRFLQLIIVFWILMFYYFLYL